MVTENGVQGDGNTSFLRSARAGNLEKVLEHLKNNIDINTSNTNGLNALHLASKDGHVHVVSELLRRGAIVDSATKKGNTALHIASLAGQEEVVKLLLQSSASVNVQSQNGFTPLYMAAQENHDSVVKLLLANGANQSLATEDGFTPLAVAMQQGHDKVVAVLLESDTRGKVRLPALHIAAKKDDVKAATLLLENDHNPDITSKSGFTPLHIASHYGNQSIANLLIQKGADVNFLAKHNISPLHVAAKWGKTNMVSVLLEKGAHIEAKTRDGLTPLHCAARSGHEQVVDMLLERGAPISAKTKNGLAPLHMAAQGEHVDAARILLYHRAPVDEVTVDYLTALHVAAHCGHVRVAKLLLDRNADANARALNGFTPLHIACKKNRIKVVELLLRHGACISATTESGLTPLHVAAFMGCMNIVIYLLQHDASPDVPTVRGETPLHLAARANQTDIIRILLRNGAQVDARAREQQTPLHIASRLGNVDIAMLLLQHGAQVDATTKDMYTALHIAAKEGQDEVSAVLIENGAALDSSTKKGFTPLHLAAKYGHMKVAQLLLQKDADVDAQGKNGVTPLHVACHYDKQNVALILLERGASPHAPAKNGHTPLHIAARKNQMDIATTLLEYGAYADTESKAGFTPLHLSSQEGHSEISSLLIEHKANCNHSAKNGLTPMHLCAQEDNVNVAEVIYKNGANIDMVTKAGYTPLHVASHFGQSNMVRFLLQNSANVDAATAIGYTPLHQAAQQGHCHIVNLLVEHRANANAQTVNGQTPLHIARKLGYISVLDSLKSITNESDIELKDLPDDKYRVVAPEAMHETFMSDSEEEGGEDNALSDQPYRYLTVDEMKSLGDDSLPIDVTRDERLDTNRMTQSSDNTPKVAVEETVSPHTAQTHMMGKSVIDGTNLNLINQEIIHFGRKLQWKNFLVSFLVDARGGAMRGCRHSGVKMIIPSRSTCQPTRITCRYVKPQRTMHPPQLMEGEALASRVLELGPVAVKFQGPVVMEVPHFASLRGKEREIIVLRSDNGETWREHTIDSSEEIIQDVLIECFEPEDISHINEQSTGHACRFVTYDFPQYFAVVSRIRQEVHAIGSEGGMVSSSVVPQVQAVFPQGALTKKIKVGLQAQPVDPDLTAKLLGRGVAVSPIVTVEPRRRKFHKAITLSMPAPKAHSQGMINQYSGNTPTLRLLCSITGGASRAQWEDVTGSTPLTFVNDCVSFTTTVSARFWLMDCRNISEATKMATELYREVIHVPFMAKFVVFAKRVEANEARLRVFCMTDDREDKTLEKQEHFTEVAKSRDVEVLEGKPQYIEMAGNLVPVTKSGEQLQLMFKAFRENRLPFTIRVKDQHADIVGRTLFMKEPKVVKGEPPQHPICILNIILPEIVIPDQHNNISEKKDADNLQSDKYNHNNFHYIGDMRIVDLSNLLGKDYINLAPEIGISQSEINVIISRYPNSIARQAQDMIRLFKDKQRYDIFMLEYGLRSIGREDILQMCRITQNQNDDLPSGTDSQLLECDKSSTIQRIHEREEIKYSAEEKEVGESESDDENQKRTVAERREKIVKRLSIERHIPASTQKKEIVQEITEIKRKSLIEDKKAMHEEEIMLQMPTDNIIKSTVPEHVVKMKLNKLETTEVSKTDFDKELIFKFKTTVKRKDEKEKKTDSESKILYELETVDKEDKYNTNKLIRKSSPHSTDTIDCKHKLENTLQTHAKSGLQNRTRDENKFEEDENKIIPALNQMYEAECNSGEETITKQICEGNIAVNEKIQDFPALATFKGKYESGSEGTIDQDVSTSQGTSTEENIQADNYRIDVVSTPTSIQFTDGTTAEEMTKAETCKEDSIMSIPANIQSIDELQIDVIRKEATMLINNVLEESINIISQHQNRSANEDEYESEKYGIYNDAFCGRNNLISSTTIEPIFEASLDSNDKNPRNDSEKDAIVILKSPTEPANKIIQERKVELKFQKLCSRVESIDKNVDNFDNTFSLIVHDDEISSLHQDFSKISWNDSLSANTSTIADVGQNTPDNDIQDFPTDTGGEVTRLDSFELPTETRSIDNEFPPRPTPRTCVPNNEGTTNEYISDFDNQDKTTHDDKSDSELPIPKPRHQKKTELFSTECKTDMLDLIDEYTDFNIITNENKYSILLQKDTADPSAEFQDNQCQEVMSLPKESSLTYQILPKSIKSDSIEIPESIATQKEEESLSEHIEIETTTSIEKREPLHEEGTNEKVQYKIAEQNLFISADLQKGDNLKRCPSLSDKHSNLNESMQICETELQTSFYIGESSSNVIIKSKPSQTEDEKLSENDGSQDESSIGKRAESDPKYCSERSKEGHYSEPEKEASSNSNTILDVKVMRQGSETRNDLLEIETESQKSSNEGITLVNDIVSSKAVNTLDINISTAIIKPGENQNDVDGTALKSAQDKIETPIQGEIPVNIFLDNKNMPKAAKLDLVLDKSELELSEKSCSLPGAQASSGVTETNALTSNFLPDVLLVERTLEEVKLSLDAAKEELIQVVRDGKSIKQSPSEFEFKNLSHIKSGYIQYPDCDDQKGDFSKDINIPLLENITEASRLTTDEDANILESATSLNLECAETVDSNQQIVVKPMSPVNNRWSLHDVDNSSSSDSYYKSVSRPCSSDFDTVQTFHTSSEYQTALDASTCKGSTEYVSAVSTFDSSGKTISSHASMKSLSSETSGNLGSIDASDLSETLVASIGDPEFEIDIENEDFDTDMNVQIEKDFRSEPATYDSQNSMKRSQEMIFSKEEIAAESTITTPDCEIELAIETVYSCDEKKLTSSLDESSILSTSSTSAIDTVINNYDNIIGSAGSSSSVGIEMFTSTNEGDLILESFDLREQDSYDINKQLEGDHCSQPGSSEELRRRGHKRNESTSINTELIKNVLEPKIEDSTLEELGNSSNISSKMADDDHKGSESESDHDPYESEYSRAFKSPSQKKKKKEKKNTETHEQSPDHSFSPLHLVTQTIIEDALTEEIESQITSEEERRPSQNMQDYSNIPDITVTEEKIKYEEESNVFPDSILYKVKTQEELHKVEDTPIQRTSEPNFSVSDDQFNELVQLQYKQKLADLNESDTFENRSPDSPDSFEMVDQPDISDEFVIIEEVGKEASEFDVEGKGIKICSSKMVQKHDEEVEQILIKSAPAATNLGSQIFRDDLNFDFEESPPSAERQTEAESTETVANKKWIEMQLSDHAAQLRYPYEIERGVLEDIKEEDAEFEVGSSRLSSFKDSFSSTPDYDVLAGRKYFSKTEHDDISMSSLQEFENLEQAISLENRRIYQGSTDSNNGSFTKRYTIRNPCGDEISISSLKEFEGLENACIEAHLIEVKAKEEAALLLSRSDESNKSNNGAESSQNVVVITRLKTISTQSPPKENIRAILKSKLEECEEHKSNYMETSVDSLEMETDQYRSKLEQPSSEHGSADSLEINKSAEQVTSSIDSFDISRDMTTKSDADSLDPVSSQVFVEESVNSVEKEQISTHPIVKSDPESFVNFKMTSTEETTLDGQKKIVTITTYTEVSEIADNIAKDMSNDSLNLCIEETSRAATNTTYYKEGYSMMSDSMTSCGSRTLIEDTLIPVTNQYFTQSTQGELSSSEELRTKDECIIFSPKTLEDHVKQGQTKP